MRKIGVQADAIGRCVSGAAVAAALVAALSAPAAAQTSAAAATDNQGVSEIVVTATKRGDESLQRVPIAITALSQATLENRGVTDFGDYARSVPGLSFVDSGPGNKTYILRGVNSTGTGVATVGQYVDDILITGDLRQPDLRLYDVQRIEVLRGPQGTLYGAGSLSGTLRTITNPPSFRGLAADALGRVSGTASGGANYEGAVTLNVPLVDDRLALRVTGYGDHESGFIDNVRLGTHGVNAYDTYGTHAALLWSIGPATSLTANFFYQDVQGDGRNIVVKADGDLGHYKTDQFVHDPYRDHFYIGNLTLKHSFDFANLTWSSSYYKRWFDNRFDSTLFDLSFGPDFFTDVVGLSTPNALTARNDRTSLLTNEIRLNSHLGGRFEWVAGFFQQQIKSTLDARVATTNEAGYLNEPEEVAFGQTTKHQTDQYALFGELSYKITDKLTALAGVRGFYAKQHDDLDTYHPFGGFTPPLAQPRIYSKNHKVTPKFYLSYQANDRMLFYGTVSQGFRIGGGNQNDIIPLPVENRTYGPDSLWNYELGAKTSFFQRRLVINASAYRMDWSNIQVSDFTDDSNAFLFISNAGKARVYGFELEVEARPLPVLDLGGSFNYVHAELTEDQPSSNTYFAGSKGDRFPNVPRVSGSAFIQYTQPLGDRRNGVARLDYFYTGKQGTQFNKNNPIYNKIDAYSYVNLRIGIQTPRWDVMAFAENLTNVYAPVNIIEEASNLTPLSVIPLRPRKAGVEVRIRY
ncbi:TonB-dependent receptor [Flavisphingomonas formosensis]|uniref:TonB-dependent receptor n=1 Tax=Flavisphingomonas formosensis TaxID=861534 RepID=UPI0012FB66A5|nr:TonB-dependent receptor [Sphingomonas formosensis]